MPKLRLLIEIDPECPIFAGRSVSAASVHSHMTGQGSWTETVKVREIGFDPGEIITNLTERLCAVVDQCDQWKREWEKAIESNNAELDKAADFARSIDDRLQGRINQLEQSLRNVRVLAARELSRKQTTPERTTEMWWHILRFCREAGIKSSILRDASAEESCQSK